MMKTVGTAENICDLNVVRRDGRRTIDVRTHAEARWALIAVLNWAANEARERPFNQKAVRAAIVSVLDWLEPDTEVDDMVLRAQSNFSRLAAAYCDCDWLFDDAGELKIAPVSLGLFERLVEIRIQADRINRAITGSDF